MIELRTPRLEEYAAADELCMRSKAVWGYDDAFMKRCAPVLRVRTELANLGLSCVALRDGALVGVAQVECEATESELDLLFVDPHAMGAGIGRALFDWACTTAAARGATTMTIMSDPGALAFYQAMGAQLVGEAPSDAIPGRALPVLTMALTRR